MIPNSNQYLTFSDEVVKLLFTYRQVGDRPESGGLLFGEFKLPEICISCISLPYKNDYQRRFLYIPERIHQQHLIKRNFQKGFHFIGEWHTHPQDRPFPSQLDLSSMQDSFVKSDHELNYFLLLIVGLVEDMSASWLSLHNRESYLKLEIVR